MLHDRQSVAPESAGENLESSRLAVIQQAESNLSNLNPSPLTPGAFEALKDIVNDFISDLIDESLKVAKRHRSEVVSRSYVEHAGEYLIASKSRRMFRHMGTVGGILVGGALSNILAMAQAGNSLPLTGTLVSVGVGLVGTFLVAAQIVRD